MAAYAQFMTTDEGQQDAEAIAKRKAEEAVNAKASSELQDLQTNDATSAFAGLVESENIEKKAIAFTGSGDQEGAGEESLITQNKRANKDIAMLDQTTEN